MQAGQLNATSLKSVHAGRWPRFKRRVFWRRNQRQHPNSAYGRASLVISQYRLASIALLPAFHLEGLPYGQY